MAAELKREYEAELELVKKEHADKLELVKREHDDMMRVFHERAETAEQKAAAILADCASEVGRREREVEIAWKGRVEALTVQLNSDMVATREKMVNDVREQYEREKREAMLQLSEELIPKIEADMAETHSVEVERYQRRIEEERKKGEARAKHLEEQVAKVREELAETIQAMADMSSANVEDAAAREKLHEVLEDNLRLRKELSERSVTIGEMERSIVDLEGAVVGAEDEIIRLQAAVADLAADREAADQRALLEHEAASAEVEELRETTTALQVGCTHALADPAVHHLGAGCSVSCVDGRFSQGACEVPCMRMDARLVAIGADVVCCGLLCAGEARGRAAGDSREGAARHRRKGEGEVGAGQEARGGREENRRDRGCA